MQLHVQGKYSQRDENKYQHHLPKVTRESWKHASKLTLQGSIINTKSRCSSKLGQKLLKYFNIDCCSEENNK